MHVDATRLMISGLNHPIGCVVAIIEVCHARFLE